MHHGLSLLPRAFVLYGLIDILESELVLFVDSAHPQSQTDRDFLESKSFPHCEKQYVAAKGTQLVQGLVYQLAVLLMDGLCLGIGMGVLKVLLVLESLVGELHVFRVFHEINSAVVQNALGIATEVAAVHDARRVEACDLLTGQLDNFAPLVGSPDKRWHALKEPRARHELP